LFKDVPNEAGTATTTSVVHTHRSKKPIIYLTATSPKNSLSLVSGAGQPGHKLIAVFANGALLCLDGETLEQKWDSSPSLFTQELGSSLSAATFQVDYVQSVLAADVIDGIFDGKNNLFGVFQEKIHRDGFNPDVLVAITSLQEAENRVRHLHILVLPGDKPSQQSGGQNVISILVAPLPTDINPTKYQLDVKSGTLQELYEQAIYSYVIKGGIPRLENKLQVAGVTSFLRLSKSSVLAATSRSLSIYNPIYRSLQTTTPISPESMKQAPSLNEDGVSFELASYLAGREIVVGLWGSSLTAIQLDAPISRSSKRRAEGLLVDAIGRGISRENPQKMQDLAHLQTSTIIADAHLGVFSKESWVGWQQASAKADELLLADDLPGFEKLLAGVFQVEVEDPQMKTNGVHTADEGTSPEDTATASNLPRWNSIDPGASYPRVDKRWVVYAIRKVFAWKATEDETIIPQLECQMPESNVLGYLVSAGHLSTPNFKSAFKSQVQELDGVDSIIGEQVPALLAEVDPTMQLLSGYLTVTHIGPTELTSAIKLLLRSLDLLDDPPKHQQLRIANGPNQEHATENDVISMELDRAEEELQITQFYLDSELDSRTSGLSVAFSKLASCPPVIAVQSLRRLFQPREIICLLNVLRSELINDGWTRRYLDGSVDDKEQDENEAAPDGSIKIIADLMCRCLDSVGLGGWMAFDATLSNGSDEEEPVDYFSQVQTEVSVALEGIQEAVRLQSTLAQTVKYAKRARYAQKAAGLSRGSMIRSPALPFGLKTDTRPSLDRIRAGGEIVQRSRRQIGLFQSKTRKAYSVTRITEHALLGRPGATIIKEEGM